MRWCRRYHRIVCHNTQLRAGHERQDPTTLAENSLSDGVVTLPWKERERRRLTKFQAAATTSCHALMAAVRSVRCVWAEVRLIFDSWKYEPIVSTRQPPLRKRCDATLRFRNRIWPACRPEADFFARRYPSTARWRRTRNGFRLHGSILLFFSLPGYRCHKMCASSSGVATPSRCGITRAVKSVTGRAAGTTAL